ncbi:cleavage stimulation factor subunit 2 [Nematocida displodere]|uniref:Cleavage stimulation factor subunit 2 n=1 Tax=Nematocida displodere TaxID=1805483 RepID=A0A177EGA3_9MICR|nr:cleavage stimulation factor subunit 2 [Nematocida displodere]
MAGRGCTVFVGNVEFDIPEEKIVEELSAVGRVVSFRMVTDRATGKSKGYGFCTYESPIIADMAVNKLKIMLNNRAVKINYADNNAAAAAEPENEKVDTEVLAETLDRMSPEDTKEILKHMKMLAVNRPEELKKMLKESPALLSSLLHMLFTLGLAPKEVLEELLTKSFSLERHGAQMLTRVLQYHDYEIDALPRDLREKAALIRERLLRRDS